MTTNSAKARQYNVFIEVPEVTRGLITVRTGKLMVDRGLAPGQFDSYGLNKIDKKTVIACIFSSMFLWVLPAPFIAIQGVVSYARRDYPSLAVAIGISLAWTVAVAVSARYLNRMASAADAAVTDMKDLIAPVPDDDSAKDLVRIKTALQAIQREHGTAYDDRAREAVRAVLDQNLHAPATKHLIIADSTADDADSIAIRKRTLEAKASWSRDVARAEHLVLGLEDTAAGRVPVAL